MTWEPEVLEIQRRIELAKEMGGADNVVRQHDGGKLTVRERIAGLVDPGTFAETGALAGKAEYDEQGNLAAFRPANFVAGFAKIDASGRLLPCDGEGTPLPGEVLSLRTHKALFAYITRELPKVAKTIGDSSISLRLCYPIEADGRIEYSVPHTSHLFGFRFLAGGS